VPVLTIEIDPDAVIEGNGIGAAAGNLDGLVEAARALVANPAARDEMSARAAAYVRKNHDIRDRGDDYIRLFETILEARRARGLSRLPA
jgi:glycosyltransferase involved in cell wall biosynthesis